MLPADHHPALHLRPLQEPVGPPPEVAVLLHVEEGVCADTGGVLVPGAELGEPRQADHVGNGVHPADEELLQPGRGSEAVVPGVNGLDANGTRVGEIGNAGSDGAVVMEQ